MVSFICMPLLANSIAADSFLADSVVADSVVADSIVADFVEADTFSWKIHRGNPFSIQDWSHFWVKTGFDSTFRMPVRPNSIQIPHFVPVAFIS